MCDGRRACDCIRLADWGHVTRAATELRRCMCRAGCASARGSRCADKCVGGGGACMCRTLLPAPFMATDWPHAARFPPRCLLLVGRAERHCVHKYPWILLDGPRAVAAHGDDSWLRRKALLLLHHLALPNGWWAAACAAGLWRCMCLPWPSAVVSCLVFRTQPLPGAAVQVHYSSCLHAYTCAMCQITCAFS